MINPLHNISLTNKQKGMLYAFLGYTSFGFSDTCAKWASAHYSVFQINASNYLIASITLLLMAQMVGGFASVWDKQTLRLQLFRGVLNFSGSILVMYSLSIMPMASVYTMIFVMPFFSVMFAVPLYQEKMHMARMVVLGIGFVGIVVAFQPWVNGFDFKLIYPLVASAFIALMFTTARGLKPETTIFALGITPLVTGFCITVGAILLIQNVPAVAGIVNISADIRVPEMMHLPILVINGMFVCGGILGVSQAFRIVSADLAAPFIYSEMIWAILFGFIVFGDVPDAMMLLGATIIIGGGFYLVRHENEG